MTEVKRGKGRKEEEQKEEGGRLRGGAASCGFRNRV